MVNIRVYPKYPPKPNKGLIWDPPKPNKNLGVNWEFTVYRILELTGQRQFKCDCIQILLYSILKWPPIASREESCHFKVEFLQLSSL